MIDITHKITTLRIAKAIALMRVSKAAILAIRNNKVPKGDVFGTSRAAALLAVKNTQHVLPHCHPIPVEYTDVQHEIVNNSTLKISVTVKTIYKTGCEMEAMHGASVAGLTIYDMLKPIDKDIEITSVKLVEKSGGKSDYKNLSGKGLSAAVIVASDSVYAKKEKDKSGQLIKEKLELLEFRNPISVSVVPDKIEIIQAKIKDLIRKKVKLIVTTGGTGASVRDVTADAIKPLLDKELEGIMEAARTFGQQRMPYSMFSGSAAGFAGDTLILSFPGSSKAVKEYFDVLFPYVLHLFNVRAGARH